MNIPTCIFSKPFQHLDIAAMCEKVKAMGFSGIDLTTRKGGHIDTDTTIDIAADLKAAAKIIRDAGLELTMLATNFKRADEPQAQGCFEAAGELGIPLIKTGYWMYKGFGTLRDSIDQAKADLDTLVPLAEKAGTCAVIHNHSGREFLTAMACVTGELLEGRSESACGAYLDTGHIFAEGMAGSWQHAMELLSGRIKVLGVKSYGFYPEPDEEHGQPIWKRKAAAYDEGIVRWKPFFEALKQTGFSGPASFHNEYAGDREETFAQVERDLAIFNRFAANAG